MKKYLIWIIGGVLLVISSTSAYADELFFVNKNNVSLTEAEYEFVNNFYGNNYADVMTLDDYEEFVENDVMNGKITITESVDYLNNGISLLGSGSYASASKKITLSSSCTDTCYISIYLEWFTNPKVRSYDLLGAYFENTQYVSGFVTTLYYDSGSQTITEANKASNGIAATVKLPTSVTDISMRQTFRVKKQGRIYASYQHASKSISLANSKKYTFSKAGVANVFLFQDGIKDYYDQMNGINIAVN